MTTDLDRINAFLAHDTRRGPVLIAAASDGEARDENGRWTSVNTDTSESDHYGRTSRHSFESVTGEKVHVLLNHDSSDGAGPMLNIQKGGSLSSAPLQPDDVKQINALTASHPELSTNGKKTAIYVNGKLSSEAKSGIKVPTSAGKSSAPVPAPSSSSGASTDRSSMNRAQLVSHLKAHGYKGPTSFTMTELHNRANAHFGK